MSTTMTELQTGAAELDPRVSKLFDYVEERNATGVFRSEFFRIAAESLRETAGQPRMMRRALAFAHLLDNVTLEVQPHELLGGTLAGLYPNVKPAPYAARKKEAQEAIERYRAHKSAADANRMRRTMYGRIHYHGNILYTDLQSLIRELAEEYADAPDLSRLEIARELEEYFTWDFCEDAQLVGELPWEATNHNDMNPPKFLARGLPDIRREAAERLDTCEPEQREFYQCEIIAADALIRFVNRYAEAYEQAAAVETEQARAADLQRIARSMRTIASGKPETFFDALQMVWLINLVSHMQAPAGSCASYARFDQYILPFYQRDVEAGRLSVDEALALICTLYVKTNEPKMRQVISLCLGGQTPEGKDAANVLTRLCLTAVQLLRQPFPNVSVRLFDGSPEWLWDMAVETIKCGNGMPMLLNDNVWVENFRTAGCTLSDARSYYNMGCVEMLPMGTVARWCNTQDINFPNILQNVLDNGGQADMALNKMSASSVDERIFTTPDGMSNFPYPPLPSLATGELEELDTFDKFLEAYRRQLYHALSDVKVRSDICDRIHDEYWCDPFGSLFHDDCLERGKDIYRGGARYDAFKVVTGLGLGTAVDSLMAVKKFVYDQKYLSLPEMKKLLDENFAGKEALRQLLVNATPAFGNDLEETDALAGLVFGWYADATDMANRQGIRGHATTSSFSYTAQVTIGEATGAMPNGRKRGEIISDSICPSQGRDMGGPTRMLRSVTALDPKHITGASSVNLKLTPSVVKGSQGSKNMKALFKGYFTSGGSQLQVNFVDSATLRAAQAEPDKYKSLVVRVAGYCEYFNNLDEQLQNEIIARTDHGIS